MKVILGGYNIDAKTIRELSRVRGEDITPEVISASYARISRDPRRVTQLREEARREVERARKSNTAIVFGLGHSSVAEHAVFNFDIMDISRLAVEAVEGFRIASFTEKSQRYIKLGRDFIKPVEIYDAGFGVRFESLMSSLADAYEELGDAIRNSGVDEGSAREDARYLMPLAASAQLGMTVNARELEYMAGRLSVFPLEELRMLSRRLSREGRRVAPSLIRYPEPSPHVTAMKQVRGRISSDAASTRVADERIVTLVEATENADMRLATSLIFGSGVSSYREAERQARKMGARGRARLISWTLENMRPWDGTWREFENVRFLFEVIVSASCYAQMKRHRMTTQIVQRYDPRLGVTVPGTVRQAAYVRRMRSAIMEAQRLYGSLVPRVGAAAEYVLTNAHRRRVLLGINLRELYHFSRLRSDRHAQWEIRDVSNLMCAEAVRVAPAGASLLGGKDEFQRA